MKWNSTLNDELSHDQEAMFISVNDIKYSGGFYATRRTLVAKTKFAKFSFRVGYHQINGRQSHQIDQSPKT
jgi:hypothetical protein